MVENGRKQEFPPTIRLERAPEPMKRYKKTEVVTVLVAGMEEEDEKEIKTLHQGMPREWSTQLML